MRQCIIGNMLSVAPRRLIHGTFHCGKTTALVEAAATFIDEGYAASQMLGLSVHRHAVRGLRAALHDRLDQDVPVADVRRRAVALLEQFPAAAGLPSGWSSTEIISALDRRVLMRRAWADAATGPDSLYTVYGSRPGALDWLVRVFDQFSEWSGTAGIAHLLGPTPDDTNLAELWNAYRAYLALSLRLRVVAFQEVVPRALDLLRHDDIRAKVTPRLLLLDDIDLFRTSELLFAQALVAETTAIVAVAGTAPTIRSPDAAVRYLAAWCETLRLEPDLEPLQPRARPNVSYVEAPTVAHEVAAIAQHIATTFPEGGRFADYAVISFDSELLPLLRRTLPQWGIAVEGMEARDAYALAIAPLLHAGIQLLAGVAVPLEELTAWIRHPIIGLTAVDRRLLRTGTATWGAGDDPLVVLKRWLSLGFSPEGRRRLQQIARATEALRGAGMPPSAKLRRWIAELDLPMRAAAETAAALEPWAVAADAELLERWITFLERAERLRAQIGEPLNDAEAADVLRSCQALVEPISRRLADGVSLWQPDQLSGCSAAHVWIAGLHEGALPQRQAPLPWVEPEAFTALSWLPGYVPPERETRAARWGQAQDMLARAMGRAQRELVLSSSGSDSRGRRRLRSPVLDTLLRRLDAEGRTPSPPTPLSQAGRGRTGQSLLPSPRLGEGPGVRVVPPLQNPVTQAPTDVFTTSPTAIEDFLHCPRRYFYARVLNLYDVVSSPRQALGQAVHAALKDLKQQGDTAPSAGDLVDLHWPAGEHRFGTRLREAAFWRMAERAVAQVAASDANLTAGTPFVAGEISFRWRIAPDVELRGQVDRVDRGPDGLIVLDYKLGSSSPSIKNLLDMFVPPLERAARVAWRPSDLQLPLYVLAIERGAVEGLPDDAGASVAEVGLVYPLQLFTATGKPAAGGRRMIRIVEHTADCPACQSGSKGTAASGLLCRDQLRAIEERALKAIAEMRAGVIDPDPIDGARTCGGCAFRAICPAPQA